MKLEMLNIAIENLSTVSGLMIEAEDTAGSGLADDLYDGVLKVFYNGLSFNLPLIIKGQFTVAQLPFVQASLSKRKGILVFEYATKPLKEKLRRLNINYIELSGNAYIAHEGAYIFVDTNKRISLRDSQTNAAFSKTGLKVIYHLLDDKNATDYSYRELGERSGVSIDTIGRVYRELVRDKYLIKVSNRKYQIIDYDRLFKDWITLFNKTLRPKLKKRSFRFTNQQKIHVLLETDFKGKIGGELAAEQITNFNIAESATIYVEGSFVELAIHLGLRPDKEGHITMLEPFWQEKTDDTKRLVALPLIYADLVSTPTPRNLATAKLIFNQYAGQFV